MNEKNATGTTDTIDISLICLASHFIGDLAAIHREFREVVLHTGRTAEFIYVLDGPRKKAEEGIAAIREDRFPLRIFRLAKGFGEASGLQYAFNQARGRYIITIPAKFQADPSAVPEILSLLDGGCDVVVTRREPRRDPLPNRIQSKIFHWLIRRMTGTRTFSDLTCGLRGLHIDAARKLDIYGDLHRFIPVIAIRRGFNVTEIPVPQRSEDRTMRVFGPGVYARRLLDILNVFFLTRFTRKPLRFFGLIGMVFGFIGFVTCAVLAVQRLFFSVALAGRPLLILGVLLLVLGAQLASIGMLGEIIIFHSMRRKQPDIREITIEGSVEDNR